MRVSSPTSHLAIAPGDRREIPIDVINTLPVIDGVTARVVGLPERNVTARPSMLPLFPDAAGQITLAIELPQTFPAGTHPLTIEVASRQPDTPPEYVNVDLSVPLTPAIELVSRPEVVRARRTGRFIVTATNRGNTLLDVDLAVTDPQKNCSVTVQPATLQLPAGESAEAVVTVRGRRIWMGVDNDRALIAEATGRAVTEAVPGSGTAPGAAPGVLPGTTGIPGPRPGGDGDGVSPEVAPKPVDTHTTITFRQRPYLTRGLLTALILIAIIALWAAAFLFGLSKVFSGDPLTKSAPASFFAATSSEPGGANGSGTGAGTEGTGTDGTGTGTGEGSTGADGSPDGSGGTGTGAATDAAPAGALPKTGTLPPGVGGAISGTVTAASSGEPVGRILVTALRVKADGSAVPVASAATQSDGTYQVAGLFPGPYLLKFEAPGFRTTYFPAATDESGAKQLTAATGAVTSGGDAVVIGLPATITGKVDFGDITEPITATVSARLLGAPAGTDAAPVTIPDVSTTDDGTYTLRNLPAPGTYQLTFTAPGYEISTVQASVTGGANRFVSAAVLSAGNVQITGTVTDGVNPLGGATVSLTVGGQQISTGTPTVGQVGHFVIDNLPTPATYILTVSKDGYGQVSQVIDLGPSGQQSELTIALTSGTGVVTGTVTGIGGAGIGGALVVAGGLADPPQTTTVTDGAIGTFQLAGLPVPGSYTLTVTAPGYAEQTVPVVLAADAVLPPLDIALVPSSGVITGRVLGDGGAGVAGASVSVTDGQKVWPVVTTSASAGVPAGSFTVADLPSGQYTVTATALDKTGVAQSRTTLVTVVPGNPVTLTFTLTSGG